MLIARFSAVSPRLVPVVMAVVLPVSACGGTEARAPVEPAGPEFDYSTVAYDAEPGPSALRGDRFAPDFPPPVIDPRFIVSGGVAPDAIVPVDDPNFMPVAEVRFLQPSEAVIVIEAGIDGDEQVKAYPVQIMIWHEIVNDAIGGVPVSITYCPLCNSAVAFERQLGDRVLDFGTSGELYQSALVMYDRQTESLWAHFSGRGLVGHYAGALLTIVPAQTMSFEQLERQYPDALVLTRDTGASRAYGVNPYTGYEDEESGPIEEFIVGDIDDRLDPMTRVVGIVLGRREPVAVRIVDAERSSVTMVPGSEESGDGELVVFHQPGLASALERAAVYSGRDVGQAGVFIPRIRGRDLSFTAAGDGFVDAETGSTWTIAGEAVAGPLAGSGMEPVPHLTTFWFAWSAYYPRTGIQET